MTGSNGSKVRVPNEAFDFGDYQIYEFEGRPFTSIAVADEPDGGVLRWPTIQPRRAPPSADRNGDADPTAGVGAVTGDLLVEVEPTNLLASFTGGLVQPIGRNDPGNFKLQ